MQATYTLDAMGRVTDQKEYNANATAVVYEKTATYGNASNILSDQITTVRSDGTYVQGDTYTYAGYDSTDGLYDRAFQGVVTDEISTLTLNGTAKPTSETQNNFNWYEQPEVNYTTYYPYGTSNSTVYHTTYNYDKDLNFLVSAVIQDGSPRTVTYIDNLDDQILASDNTKGPQARNYFFNGVEMAQVSNDGTGNVTYSQSITQQTTKPGTGFYGVDDSTTPIATASFGTQFENINGFGNQTPLVSSYTVQGGDTLVSIAQAIWGDGNFWYLLAQANGLSSDATLSAGQVLSIPQNVIANQNTSSTVRSI